MQTPLQPTLIDQGLSLMLYGMGTVFVFLCILVFAILIMSKVVNRFSDPEPTAPIGTAPSNDVDSKIRRAIEQAISLHRNRS